MPGLLPSSKAHLGSHRIRLGGFFLSVLTSAALAAMPSVQEEYRLGQQLFVGDIDLQGRIRTHLADLPPDVVRCGNCHAAASGPEVPRSLAPRLTRNLLLERRPRRGGPSSSYSLASFCKLLRIGVDPAYVLISLEMPQYTLDDAHCLALWRFLTWSENAPKSQ
jgi:hypothetical protein